MNTEFQLSKEQIQQVIDFTKKKYVKFEDVRYELVDHLATDIEVQMAKDSNLLFETALKRTYSKFPITGFQEFVGEKHAALTKYWKTRIWSIFKNNFSIPKVIITLLIFTFCFNVELIFPAVRYGYFLLVVALLNTAVSILEVRKIKRAIKQKYLFIYVLTGTVGSFCFYSWLTFFASLEGRALFQTVFRTGSESFMSTLAAAYLSIVITFNILLIVAMLSNQITDILKEEIRTKYKHLNIELNFAE